MSRSRNSRRGRRDSVRCYDCNDGGCEWCRPWRESERQRLERARRERPRARMVYRHVVPEQPRGDGYEPGW